MKKGREIVDILTSLNDEVKSERGLRMLNGNKLKRKTRDDGMEWNGRWERRKLRLVEGREGNK